MVIYPILSRLYPIPKHPTLEGALNAHANQPIAAGQARHAGKMIFKHKPHQCTLNKHPIYSIVNATVD